MFDSCSDSSPHLKINRLADLHRTMNVHAKPPSVAAEDEGAWQGVWPTGRVGGKKGDILKLVSWVTRIHMYMYMHTHIHVHVHVYSAPYHC